MGVLLEVPKLVTPLGENAEGVLKEGDDDHEAADSGEMGLERLRVDFDMVLNLLSDGANLLERVVWVGGAVASGWARVCEAMWVGLVAALGETSALGPPDVDTGCHCCRVGGRMNEGREKPVEGGRGTRKKENREGKQRAWSRLPTWRIVARVKSGIVELILCGPPLVFLLAMIVIYAPGSRIESICEIYELITPTCSRKAGSTDRRPNIWWVRTPSTRGMHVGDITW
jgi:hypothetical protein